MDILLILIIFVVITAIIGLIGYALVLAINAIQKDIHKIARISSGQLPINSKKD